MTTMTTKVTPVGTAKWCKVNNKVDVNPNNGKRTYQVILELPNADAQQVIDHINEVFAEFKALPENKGKKWSPVPSLGYSEDNGVTTFKAWTLSENKDKTTGAETPKIIPVFVVNQGFLDNSKSIGNGSKIQVSYTIRPFHSSATSNGVSLILNKVLVHSLVEYGGSSIDMSEFGIDTSAYEAKPVTAENFMDSSVAF